MYFSIYYTQIFHANDTIVLIKRKRKDEYEN